MSQLTIVASMLAFSLSAGALVSCVVSAQEQKDQPDFRVVKEWRFEKAGDMQGWTPGNVKDAKVENGALRGTPANYDPILPSPVFDMPATEFQWVRVTMRCPVDGEAQVFYSNTTQGEYGGFSGKKVVTMKTVGAPEFRTYHFYPFWGPEKKIVHIRLDPPNTGPFEVQSIQIVEDANQSVSNVVAWDFRNGEVELSPFEKGSPVNRTSRGAQFTSTGGRPPFMQRTRIKTDDFNYVVVRMAVTEGATGLLSYAVSDAPGCQFFPFPLRADGRMHTYNLEPDTKGPWSGEIVFVALEPATEAGAKVTLESIRFARDPEGPPDLELRYFGISEAIPRAGTPTVIACNLYNHGGEAAAGLTAKLTVPEGVQIVGEPTQNIEAIPYSLTRTIEWKVVAQRPVKGEAKLEITGPEPINAIGPVEFLPSLNLPKAEYVPPPKPVDTNGYQVGVYYFPGWADATRWAPIQSWPNRKPVLGWYAEGSPEVADWQIKWMLEHGITWIAYDWYWCKGARHLEHGIHDALFKARYQDMIKFCLLYANHNPKGTTSVEDSIALTKFWIENYFKRPNYLRVNGKPVIIIFSPRRIIDDIGHEHVKAMFDKMDAVCQEQGIPGITMVACSGPDPKIVQMLKEEGYSALSGYNYPGLDAGGRHMLPFAHLCQTTEGVWNKVADTGLIKEIPCLSGGWDPRPWHGPSPGIYYPDVAPTTFLGHCQAAKKFLDTRDKDPRLCIVEAWNEWGEGSIIEPHAQDGFGFLDAIRQVFAPNAGPHTDITPADVGLGPYDVKPFVARTEWTFDKDGDTEDWRVLMQISNFRAEGGALKFESTGGDPALSGPPLELPAAKYKAVLIRMKASGNDKGQFFWGTTSAPVTGQTSLTFDVIGDGAMHDYTVPVAENRRWRGIIKVLRFDPGMAPGVKFEIDAIRLVAR